MTTKIPAELSSTPGIVDNSDATAITIDSSENVGIGTASPSYKLEVSAEAAVEGDVRIIAGSRDKFIGGALNDIELGTYSSNNTSRDVHLSMDSAGNVGIGLTNPTDYYSTQLVLSAPDNGGITLASTTTSASNYIMFADGTSGTDRYKGYVSYGHNDNQLNLVSSGYTRFFTDSSQTERMRINSDGHLLIGTTSAVANSRLRVKSSGSSASEYTCEMGSADNTTQFLLRSDGAFFTGTDSNSPFNSAGASANVQVLSNGALTRVSSSRRYKQDITDATWGLDEVKQLRPVTFRSNRTDELCDPNVHGGFIAEEVHDIGGLTSFIGYDENNEAETLHYGNMVSLLTKAIQEQQDIIEDLKSRIETLEG